MAKKPVAVSLRKPPADADPIVTRAARGAHSYIAELKAQVDDLRTITVRLPRELAGRLLERCMQDNRAVSDVVAEMVRAHLDGVPPRQQDPELTLSMIVRWVTKRLASIAPRRSFTKDDPQPA